MQNNNNSRLTLADVRDALKGANELSPVRIRDLCSAISCFCDLTGEAPDGVPLHLAEIRDKLNAINPVAAGISAKRLANIRSDLFAAIAASQLKPLTPTPRGLTDPWRELRSKLNTKRRRIGLSRLAHYGSAAGLRPVDIDDAVIIEFMTSIRENSLHRKPNDLYRQTAVIWNEVASELPHLGLREVGIPSFRHPPRRADWSLFPESFHEDLETYLAWCACTDPFIPDARSRPLATATTKLRRTQIHAAVTALVESGVQPTSITCLGDLVTVANFKTIAQRRLKMSDSKENSFNRALAAALVQMAREWVKVDNTTLLELKRLASKVPAPRVDLTAKNKRFLRQFDDPLLLQRLRSLPSRLWSQVRRDESPNFRTLSFAQAALALEILTYMPLRMQNLIRLEFDVHLFLRDGPGAISTLEIDASEVKNKRPIEFDIPTHITRMLIVYRDHIAPRIIGRRPGRLFVNPDGTPKHAQTLSHLIRRIVRRYAGLELSPHQFRHLAAKILLDDSPGAFELVKQLLGHSNLKTTVNSYAGIDTRRASQHHYRLLERMSADQPTSLRRSGPKRRSKPKDPSNKNGRG